MPTETDPELYPVPTAQGSTQLGKRIGDVELSEDEYRKKLGANQFKVLRLKSTEPARQMYPDGFDDHYDPGVYLCGSCVAAGHEVPLYTSKMKFDCGCGWPGFWTNVAGAVYEKKDADGRRCEILCARCDGHLGHVFRGEPFGYPTGERHCVNSLSLVFAPASALGAWRGANVRVGDLKSAPQHNGKTARCGRWLPEKARWAVNLPEEVALKPENLTLLEEGGAVAGASIRVVPGYSGAVSKPPGTSGSAAGEAPQWPPQIKRLIQQVKAAGIDVDETDREQVQKLIHMVKEQQKVQKGQMVKREDALPGRKDLMKVSDTHYVLKTPMKGPWPKGFEVMIFANGCFWGSEKGVWRLPGGGIHTTAVGYAGGFTPNPTYEEACSGRSGHTEAVQVVFDPTKIGLVDILRWFWEAHDPTCGMGQGNDRGTQYRSALYYVTDEQRQIYESSKAAYEKALQAKGKGQGSEITTEICAAADFDEPFYYAEDYHQQYLAKPGARPYCSAQPQQVSLPPFKDWCPRGLQEKYQPKLPEAFWAKHGPSPHCVIKSPHEPIKWP